jgi:hypothetical protein
MLLLKSVASVTPGLRANKTDGKIQYSEKNVEQGSKEKDQLSFKSAEEQKTRNIFSHLPLIIPQRKARA